MATIDSARQLARRIGRSNSTVSEWLFRRDWPFGQPPWPESFLPDVADWMTESLDSPPDDDAIDIAGPGRASVKAADVLRPGSPWYVGNWIAEPHSLTTEEAAAVARKVNVCLVYVLIRAHQDAGRGERIRNPAPASYWAELWELFLADAKYGQGAANLINGILAEWAATRGKR